MIMKTIKKILKFIGDSYMNYAEMCYSQYCYLHRP